ncbi:MAG: hypothetical protein JRF22_06135, partial [Deltaproteobacteria bacterium]|nr:hypothetical protein [Deltaproteobacteria bacterium]
MTLRQQSTKFLFLSLQPDLYQTLLEKGDMLSEKHIMLLKSWGITEADIEVFDRGQVDERERETLSTAVVESIEEDLKNLFPDFGDNHLMNELCRVVRKFN